VIVAVGVGVVDTVPAVGIVWLDVKSAADTDVSTMPTTISAAIVAVPFGIFIFYPPDIATIKS
jgi:hypothetical protein